MIVSYFLFYPLIVVNFNMRKKDLSTTHYEINFNELYDVNTSGEFDLIEKTNSLMDFGHVLKVSGMNN